MRGKYKKSILVVFSVCFIFISSFFPVISFNVDGAVDTPQFTDQTSLSCFMPGTPINMADGSYKNIENVKVGDWVKVFSPKTGEIEAAWVNQIARPWKDNMHKIYLENGKILQASANHPFMTKNKGWTTIDSSDITNINAGKLEIGDYLYSVNVDDEIEEVKVVDIVPIEGMYRAYDLVDMKYYTYIANDILVHNSEKIAACFAAGTKISMADGTTRNIEDIQIGDKIFSFDIGQDKVVTSTVTEVFDILNENGVYNINEEFLRCTGDHPLFVYKPDGTEGWAALDPALSETSYFKGIIQLEVGDRLFTRKTDGKITSTIVHSIVYEPGCIQVYSLSVDHEAHNFFANEVMAHNVRGCPLEYELEVIVTGEITITIRPLPPVEDTIVTIFTSPYAEDIRIYITDKYRQIDTELSAISKGQGTWQCFIPKETAGKYLYVYAFNLRENTRGELYERIEAKGFNILPNASIDSISPNPVETGKTVSFAGHGSDSDGSVVAYSWRSSIDGQLGTLASFSLPSLSVGTHTIYFKVQDDASDWSLEDSLSLVVSSSGNNLPNASIDSISPNPVETGKTVSFAGHGSDSDGSVVAYSWRSSIDGQLGTLASFSLPSLSVGTHTIYFKVQDDASDWSLEDSLSLVVSSSGNNLPNASIDSISPNPVETGKTVSFAGHGSDSDGSVVAYSWRSSIDGQLGTLASFSLPSLSVGTHTIYFKVQDDASDWSLEDSLSLVVSSSGNNLPNAPNTPSPDNGSVNVSVNIILNWSCSDPDGDSLTYDVYFGTDIAPPIISTNQSNTTYNPDFLNCSTTYYWWIQAEDSWGAINNSPLWSFATKEEGITVTFPNGYERVQGTNTYNITWNFTEGTGDNVKIELYKNDSQYNIINEDTPNDGSYSWHIPEYQPEGYYYKIKISSTSNTSIFDYSDNNFTITLEPSLTLNIILQRLRCYEKLIFEIQIVDGNSESVPNATVYFSDQKINSDRKGSAFCNSPEVDKNVKYFIYVSKPNYTSYITDIIIENINLETEMPESVEAGEKFTVKITFPGQPELSQDLQGMDVELFNDTIQVTDKSDANGEVVFTAPGVDQDTFFDIIVYAGPVTAQGLILVKKPAGNISGVFTDNWLLIVVALIIALILALFLRGTSSRRNRKLSINAPIHVDGDTEFAVKVRDTKDKPVADARVEFNNIKKKTDKDGVAVFKTPPIFSDVKELYVIANKDNNSSTVSMLIGGNMKKAKEQSKKKPPSNEEVPTFSPAIKNIQPSFADVVIERKEDIDKIRKISSTSDDMIYRLVDTVIDRHRKNK